MGPNPYLPPEPSGGAPSSLHRTPLVLAAVGAVLAALYWAALTLLIGAGTAAGSVSGTQIILPVVLVALYGWRGYQVFQGNPVAVRSLLWLHGLGGILALVQAFTGSGTFAVLQGVKFVIHGFGIVTALMAKKAIDASLRDGTR